jgi:very-short-patch-repair endonuclease
MRQPSIKRSVLVAVLKNSRDLRLLLAKHWYRIPVEYLPKKKFEYIAFYQPAGFGGGGKRICYYARVTDSERARRVELLPEEADHPRAGDTYQKFSFQRIETLPQPIRNVIPRRISFGFTDLKTLLSARDMLELYGVQKTEQIVAAELRRLDIKFKTEHVLTLDGKRYRIDITIFCKKGNIAIECDNRKAHSGKTQKAKDRSKDAALRRHGWQVIRLTESEVVENAGKSIRNIARTLRRLGGIMRTSHEKN